jgi:hypothetical protein
MNGRLTAANTQGIVLSILFARANSIAPADQGLINTAELLTGVTLPPVATAVVFSCDKSCDEIKGEEKDRR